MLFLHEIIFFDTDVSKINAYEQILSNNPLSKNISFMVCDFENLIHQIKIDIAISPANSYLSMTGGIDKVYNELFPGIENKLRSKMMSKKYEKSHTQYKGTKYILPIGKTIIEDTENNNCRFIMASPTMKTPKDITGTNNVYCCMMAILKKLSKLNFSIVIACPCLGTGIGNLSPVEPPVFVPNIIGNFVESANQINTAINNFHKNHA